MLNPNMTDDEAFDLVESLPASRTELLHLVMTLSVVADGLVEVQRDMAGAMEAAGVRLDPEESMNGLATFVAYDRVSQRVAELRRRLCGQIAHQI